MDRESGERVLAEARAELHAAQKRVVHLQQVVDGLGALLSPELAGSPARQRVLTDSARDVARHNAIVRAQRATTREPITGLGREFVDRTIGNNSALPARVAIMKVMARNAGVPMTPKRIYSEILERGYANPEFKSGQAAYDTALRRIVDEPDAPVVQDANGSYIYRPPSRTELEMR